MGRGIWEECMCVTCDFASLTSISRWLCLLTDLRERKRERERDRQRDQSCVCVCMNQSMCRLACTHVYVCTQFACKYAVCIWVHASIRYAYVRMSACKYTVCTYASHAYIYACVRICTHAYVYIRMSRCKCAVCVCVWLDASMQNARTTLYILLCKKTYTWSTHTPGTHSQMRNQTLLERCVNTKMHK